MRGEAREERWRRLRACALGCGWSDDGWPGLGLLIGGREGVRYWGIICEVSCEGIGFKMGELVEYHGAGPNAEVD